MKHLEVDLDNCKQIDNSDYYVTCNGRIWNAKTMRYVTGTLHTKGYTQIVYYVDGIRKRDYLHRLVMKYFKGIDCEQVNHIDGDKLNNHPTNLEPSNNCHNINHAYETNLMTCNQPCRVSHMSNPTDTVTARSIREAAYILGISAQALSLAVKRNVSHVVGQYRVELIG
jgi:hypothetical protein